MRVSRRFLYAIALLALFHVYIGLRLLPPLPVGPVGYAIGALALFASCLLMPLALVARSAQDEEWSDRLAWIGLIVPALRPLYDYAWFVGFGAAALTHLLLMRGTPR